MEFSSRQVLWSKILVLLWIQILHLMHILKTSQGLLFITWGTSLKLLLNCKMLSLHNAEKLVHSFVTSRLDYCNTILSGCANSTMKGLQLIQNAAAHILTRTRRFEHISPVLASLHWACPFVLKWFTTSLYSLANALFAGCRPPCYSKNSQKYHRWLSLLQSCSSPVEQIGCSCSER